MTKKDVKDSLGARGMSAMKWSFRWLMIRSSMGLSVFLVDGKNLQFHDNRKIGARGPVTELEMLSY